jgi:hypothetical protein
MISIELLVVFAQDSRTSEQCSVCHSQKKPDYAFCPRCYYSLSPTEKMSLGQGSTEDYLRAYVDCWLKLKQGEQVAAERVVQSYGKPVATSSKPGFATPRHSTAIVSPMAKPKRSSKAEIGRRALANHRANYRDGLD